MPVGITTDVSGAGRRHGNTVGKVTFVTGADFRQKVLEGEGPIAVEFMSFACGHCRRANPMVHDVAAALGNRIKVYQVNVPEEQELARKYQIEGTPTFIMFQNGQQVGRGYADLTPAGIRRVMTEPFGIR